MNKEEKPTIEELKNYLYALEWYKLFGNKYGDKDYIDNYEKKYKVKKKEIGGNKND